MDKRMHLCEEKSMTNNAAKESSGELFVRRVASSGMVVKFKVGKYGKLPSEDTISSQEMMSGEKQNVRDPLNNLQAICSPNAISLLEQPEISTADTKNNKISLFDKAKVARPDEIINTPAMVDINTMVHKQIVPSGSIAVGSKGVYRMNETNSTEKAKIEHLVMENGSNNGIVGHTCDECGKNFKEISSLHGHKGIHRREYYKSMRMMQQPIPVVASHAVSSRKSAAKEKRELRKIWGASQILQEIFIEYGQRHEHQVTCTNEHNIEETAETREVAEVLTTLEQKVSKDTADERFMCPTCKRTFSTYNGLGGHMSVHNNKAKNNKLEDGVGSSSGSGEQSTSKFVCGKCNERFPTGLSLGGHKRKHWWDEFKMILRNGENNVKPPLPLLHEGKRSSGLAIVPTDEKMQPTEPVQLPQQATSLGNEIVLETAADLPAGPMKIPGDAQAQ